ncbi:MAG: adenylate/guanylate cyclase domain-containing protein [Gammaproteobacteria bacterium]|nr:adenylate/guanylate cyclase domain-containing protein [Gammaproteobacteria bacterium]
MRPHTEYAKSPEGYVAYQIFGDGPLNIVVVTNWMTNLDVMWEEPSLARYLDRLASFARVVCFDKRGTGVSDPVPLAKLPTIDQWMDDARVVMDAAGVEQAAMLGDTEGGLMALMFAATYPKRTSALVLINSFARWVRTANYPAGMPAETVEKLVNNYEAHWGVTADILDRTAPSVAKDPGFRSWFERYQRLAMPRGASATMYRWVTQVDVRSVLPSIRVPTLVINRADAAHHRVEYGRYLAEHISDAKYVELPGADTFPYHAGNFTPVLDEVQVFLTGMRESAVHDRILATVMFTDIVGSTPLAAKLGDAKWLNLREAHDRLVHDYLERYRGKQIEHNGDGVLATFDGPTRAVDCAVGLAGAVRSLGVEIRAGLHTGEIELRARGIGGIAVHIAARVMAKAVDGGVLVSRTVKDLAVGSGIRFTQYGTHQLKGIPGEWELWQVNEPTPRGG